LIIFKKIDDLGSQDYYYFIEKYYRFLVNVLKNNSMIVTKILLNTLIPLEDPVI